MPKPEKGLTDKHQGKVGDDIEYEDTDFIQGHAAIVDGIKPFFRNLEPTAVHAVNKAVAEDEK